MGPGTRDCGVAPGRGGTSLAFLDRVGTAKGCRFWGGGERGLGIRRRHMSDDMTRDGLKNQGEGIVDQAKGRLRNTIGGITGDTGEQIKGKAQELKGKAQRKIGEKQVDVDNDR